MRRSTSKLVLSAAVASTVGSLFPAAARAVDYTWNGPLGGTQSWNNAANWTPNTGFPSVAPDGANLQVGLTSGLNLNLNQNVSVGNLRLGGTAGAVTTNVGNGSTAFRLTLDNTGGANNTDSDPLAPNANPTITSGGVAGSVNTISAPVVLTGDPATSAGLNTTSNITNASTNGLTISSLVIDNNTTTVVTSGTNTGLTNGVIRTLQNNLGAGKTLTIGAITSQLSIIPTPGSSSVAPATISITNTLSIGNRTDGTFNVAPWGDVIVNGPITNGAQVVNENGTPGVPGDDFTFNSNTIVNFGFQGNNTGNSIRTITLTGPNTHNGSRIFRANLVLGHDNALGTGGFQHGSGAAGGTMGFNIASTDDARSIPNAFTMQRNITFNGEHSLTWAGTVTQSNSSSMFNLLPAGKTLTLTDVNSDNGTTARSLTFDGTGNTVVNGIMRSNPTEAGNGRFIKNGTGTVTTNGANTYTGMTLVNGGLYQFGNAGAYASTSGVSAILGGAVGALDGSTGGLITKIQANTVVSNGALALDDSDAAVNINYTGGGNMDHANTVGMGIGAAAGGVTYTGTITPAAAGYRLGGGGTLTLPNANQLTGARNLTVVNGGTVALGAANNFSGSTTVRGDYIVSLQQQAVANNGTLVTPGVFQSSTLAIAGASSLGTASDAASNLVLSGGTLRVTGAGGNSSRLFTITPVGATLDSSGSGAINFNNPGAIVSADASGITGNTTTGTTINAVNDISQLTVGMTVSGGDFPANTTVTGFLPVVTTVNAGPITQIPTGVEYRIRTSAGVVTPVTGQALTFGNQNRALNLTGSNSGNNTVAGSLSNSATGTLAVNKSGTGRWVLSNLSNNYTGGTNVSGGTLAVGRMHENNAVSIAGGTLQVLESSPTLADGLPTGNNASVSRPSSLTIAPGGTLDLTNNDMIIDYSDPGASPAEAIEDLIASGYGAADWFGTGITSSVAQQDGNFALAIADNQLLNTAYTSFSGQSVDPTTVLVKFTWVDDIDLDGKVTTGDAITFGNNYSLGDPASRATGDMDYDGVFTTNDAIVFGNNYDTSLPSLPEPGTLGVFAGLFGLGLARRRQARADKKNLP